MQGARWGGIKRIMLLYDIMCQYGVNLAKRLRKNQLPSLDIPVILKGVGVWHVYAHVRRCFGRFAPIYLLGSGLVDGETLEALWSRLMRILESCQTMSLANREETINSHINDNNWKKITEMSMYLPILRLR